MKNFLTTSQRSFLKSAHRIERDRKIGERMKVVLLGDQGESFTEIAKFLFIDEQTARRHLQDYFDNDKLGGSSGGSEGKLTPEQAARLSAILATCDVASAQSVVQQVKGLFGVKFSLSGMTDWFKRNGFSFNKSAPAPAKTDPQAQLEFIDTYRTLKDSLPEGESLLFLDAAHPTMATQLGYGWLIKGEREIVATTAGKTRVNPEPSFAPSTLFWTKAPIACARPHKQRRHAWASSSGTFHLPPYAPNLNLIERAWKVMNEEVRNNVYFPDAKTFTSTIKDFFLNRWSKLSKSLITRFADNFQVIKKPAF